MFSDMQEAAGGFGHGIAIGPYNPIDELLNTDLSRFERFGVYIAIVCLVSDLIDESTYADALDSDLFARIDIELKRGTFTNEVMVERALQLALRSEAEFYAYLPTLYDEVVLPRLSSPSAV